MTLQPLKVYFSITFMSCNHASLIERLESRLDFLEKENLNNKEIFKGLKSDHEEIKTQTLDLQKENKELKLEVKQLKKENKILKGKLKAYENSNTPSSKKRNKKQTQGPYKKSGREKGHPGSGRPFPKPTEEKEFKNSCCPNCSSIKIEELGKETIIQEEISKPEPIRVIKNTIFKYKCKCCNRSFEAKNDVFKHSRVGINLATEIMISKFEERLPLQKIQNRLKRRHNCYVSKAGILGIITRVTNYLNSLHQKLMNLLITMKFIYADETSWRVKGKNNWLWSFSNKLLSVFLLRKGRGKNQLKKCLTITKEF